MVAKISHGMSLYGALAYNYEKVAAGTAEILSGNRMIFRPARIAKRGHTPGIALFRELPAGKPQHGEARPAYLALPGTGRPVDRRAAGRTGGTLYAEDGVWESDLTSPTNMPIHTIPISILLVSVWMNRGKDQRCLRSIGVP